MPKLNNRPPKYSKMGKYAVVYYGGKSHYLGRYGSDESKIAYSRLLAEIQASPTGVMIDNAVPQEIVLYSCDENEVSLISNEGSYYSQYLLAAAEIAMTQLHVPAKNVRRIHDAAVEMMRQDDPFSDQHPRILEPHRLVHRRLPFAINPNRW